MKFKKLLSGIMAAALAVTAVSVGTNKPAVVNYFSAEAAVSTPAASTALLESAYITWTAIDGAEGYNVYYGSSGSWTQLDSMLIRQYSGYFRADAVGLKAGKYTMKVVPVFGGKEDTSKEIVSSEMAVTAHDRSGYGFVNGTSSGAYNEDGTLKSDAIVVYVTNENKDTVTKMINVEGKGEVECVGVQNIINGYKKGKETRPISVRFIGNIEDPANMPKGDLMVDGAVAGMTIEGIGSDTVFNGFGLVLKNCSNVEVRNIGFMNCNSEEGDDVGLQQGDDHCWVHNCDFFYGDAGTDADQVKGDGALDTKKSHYITHSYNHFWDNGKCNLQGASASDTSDFITYHHNWYDHSDSRHPRVRVATVHVYNNYYDGNAKYGIGSTTGSSVFSENNYFRNCKYPMLTAMQGSDTKYAESSKGTFSGEAGGTIKAYGNYMEGQKAFTAYSEDNTDFDAYVAASRGEMVPSSVTSKLGGNTYNNFDTASDMYSYTVDAAKDVPAVVTARAGRVDGGDFQWKFDNSVDDASYAVNAELKAALVNYKSSIVAIGSGFKENVNPTEPSTAPSTEKTTEKITEKTMAKTTDESKQTTASQSIEITGNIIYCSPDATSSGKGTKDNPVDVLTALKNVKAGGAIYLLGGTYKFDSTIKIDADNCGEAGKYKTIMAVPGENVVWDFSGQGTADANRGVILRGSYWYFKGFEITKAGDNGMLLAGNNNRIEMMVFNDNQDTGLQVSRIDSSQATIDTWPSNNLILNCTSKNNCDDATMENADGFAAKLTCGKGNIFDGCMAYNNSDDGWDLFAKDATGPIGVVTIQNCIAFRNGYTEFGEGYGDCDGNGFKLGGSGVGSPHIVKNCLAFENLHCGFTDNNNPELAKIIDCTSVNNDIGGGGKPNFSVYRCTNCDFDNLISYYNNGTTSPSSDKFVGVIANSVYTNSKGWYRVDGDTSIDTQNAKVGTKFNGLTDAEFVSVSVPVFKEVANSADAYDFHKNWRNSDGSINTGGYMELKETSDFYKMGAFLSTQGTVPPPTEPDTGSTEGSSDKTDASINESKLKCGDVNTDGTVDLQDIVALAKYFADTNSYALSEEGMLNADSNHDGSITNPDAVNLLKFVSDQIRPGEFCPEHYYEK